MRHFFPQRISPYHEDEPSGFHFLDKHSKQGIHVRFVVEIEIWIYLNFWKTILNENEMYESF